MRDWHKTRGAELRAFHSEIDAILDKLHPMVFTGKEVCVTSEDLMAICKAAEYALIDVALRAQEVQDG